MRCIMTAAQSQQRRGFSLLLEKRCPLGKGVARGGGGATGLREVCVVEDQRCAWGGSRGCQRTCDEVAQCSTRVLDGALGIEETTALPLIGVTP